MDVNLGVLLAVPLAMLPSQGVSTRTRHRITTVAILLIAMYAWKACAPMGSWTDFVAGSLVVLGLRGVAIQSACRPRLAQRIACTVALTAVASAVLLFLTVRMPAFVSFRHELYPGLMATIETYEDLGGKADVTEQGGFAVDTVAMGYQLAMAVPITLGLLVARRGTPLIPALVVLGSAATLVLLGQRSALGAAAVGLLGVIWIFRSHWRRLVITAGAVAILLAGLALVGNSSLEQLMGGRRYNLIDRADSRELREDRRFEVQMWALGQIPRLPMGFRTPAEYQRRGPVIGDRVIGSHNHTVSQTLMFGWPMGALLTGLLFIGCSTSWRALRGSLSLLPSTWPAALWALSYLCVTFNGFFHNSGPASRDGPSLVAIMLLVALTGSRHRTSVPPVDEALMYERPATNGLRTSGANPSSRTTLTPRLR